MFAGVAVLVAIATVGTRATAFAVSSNNCTWEVMRFERAFVATITIPSSVFPEGSAVLQRAICPGFGLMVA